MRLRSGGALALNRHARRDGLPIDATGGTVVTTRLPGKQIRGGPFDDDEPQFLTPLQVVNGLVNQKMVNQKRSIRKATM